MNRGGGSLVGSVVTYDPVIARKFTLAVAAWHGRLYFNNRDSMGESTGHGAPLPHMVHGGPGRAGGGEEQGGIRGVLHFMQRTAVQGSADILSAISETWVQGAREIATPSHPPAIGLGVEVFELCRGVADPVIRSPCRGRLVGQGRILGGTTE